MTLPGTYSETEWSETLPNASKLYVLKQCNYRPVILRFRRVHERGSPIKRVQVEINQSWTDFEKLPDIAEEIAMKRWNDKNGTLLLCGSFRFFETWASRDNSKGKKLMELPTEVRVKILRFRISEDGKHMSPHLERYYGLDGEESEKYIWEKQFDSEDGITWTKTALQTDHWAYFQLTHINRQQRSEVFKNWLGRHRQVFQLPRSASRVPRLPLLRTPAPQMLSSTQSHPPHHRLRRHRPHDPYGARLGDILRQSPSRSNALLRACVRTFRVESTASFDPEQLPDGDGEQSPETRYAKACYGAASQGEILDPEVYRGWMAGFGCFGYEAGEGGRGG